MIGSSLMTGLGISGVSTGLYAAFTSEDEKNKYIDRKNEYLCIFCIISIVSFLLIYITSGNSESVVLKGGGLSPINNKPPF